MEARLEDPTQEIKRLQRCINDLVSLVALPAIWRGTDPSQIVEMLLDVLRRMLSLDFAYARLSDAFGATPVEVLRVSEDSKIKLSAEKVRSMLGDPLAAYAQGSVPQIRNQLAGEGIAIAPAQLGVHGEIGVIVLGSGRAGFPEKTESLLLNVAANEASIALQEARLVSEQKRVSAELNADNQMWPVLTESEIERARLYGRVRRVEIGEVLYRPGEVGRPCFILLSVSLEIVQPTIDGERLVTILRPGMFTGEAGTIAGQRTVVQARAIQAGEILEVRPESLRTLVANDAALSEILLRAFMLRRLMLIDRQLGNVVVIGSRHSADTLRLREFLSRNGHPFTYIDLDKDEAYRNFLDRFGIAVSEIPIVIGNGTMILRNPSTSQLADSLGLNDNIDSSSIHDLIIVGAGPAGLAAAVYAASEGIDALVIESRAPGGQAGSSSKIENYLGFPTGVSGQELATSATKQAQKFGAKMALARPIVQLRCQHRPYELVTDDGTVFSARTIVIATGADYNKPTTANLDRFVGHGIHFGATFLEAQLCEGEDVIVVGGGNSAGQAAVFLSQSARKVYLLVRAATLSDSMSHYLIARISGNPAIELLCSTELASLEGKSALEKVSWVNKLSGESRSVDVHHLFIMAGASPNTSWLRGRVALDEKGFILTGRDLPPTVNHDRSSSWPLSRPPLMLESSLPGIFAVGDVRAGSVKRVASAVGEGAISVSMIHRVLAEV
jgi:thioredoxin reductase (NADPH)